MSQLNHGPADILREALIFLGFVTDPDSNDAWPCFYSSEPNEPDNCITLYDTAGVLHDRDQISGDIEEDQGIQVRVRSKGVDEGYKKAKDIAVGFDRQIKRLEITLDSDTYRIHAVTRTTDVVPLGVDSVSRRRLYTVNALMTVELLPGTGA